MDWRHRRNRWLIGESRSEVRACSDLAGSAVLAVYFLTGLPFHEMFHDFTAR